MKDGTLEFIRTDLINPDAVPDPRIIPATKAQDEADRESIKKHGLLQPIVVSAPGSDGKHALIAGRRRYRLSKAVGLTRIACYVRPEPPTKEHVDNLFRDLAAAENIHRADMHMVEIASEVQRRVNLGHKHRVIADALKLGLNNVANYARVARAPFFGAMLEEVRANKPVPSYRKCLAILETHKPPTDGGKEARDEWAGAVLKAWGNACVAEAAAVAASKENGGNGVSGKPAGKGKRATTNGALKPKVKWLEVAAWWKHAEKAIKSNLHPVTGEPLKDAEAVSLMACDELLSWVYGTKKRAEPPIFVMGEDEEEEEEEAGDEPEEA